MRVAKNEGPKDKDVDNFEDMKQKFKVLANEKRLQIMWLVQNRPRTIKEIAREIETSVQAATKHCRKLEGIGLLMSHQPIRVKKRWITAYWPCYIPLREIEEFTEQFDEGELARITKTPPRSDKHYIIVLPPGDPQIIVDSGLADGKSYPVKDMTTIGRRSESDIDIPIGIYPLDLFVSRDHAKIRMEQDKYFLEDNSRNGTFMNGEWVHHEKVELKNDDRFKIGSTWLKFVNPKDRVK